MSSSNSHPGCRLCNAPLQNSELHRRLCGVCDEYAQHVALHTNKGLERIVGELQNGQTFRNAIRNFH
ncbi:MAG TPA: hypothetical protein VEZ11_17605 [Thermoanaerobaculia bacterium]|nr:hypothetical protein [Thermoanaerobaculia bacterium]